MVNKEALKGMAAEQVMQLLQEVKKQRITAAANANAAIKEYRAAVDTRDTEIRKIKDNLTKQLVGIADKAEALKPVMLKATIAGDGAKLANAQRSLDELEGQRSQLNAQLQLLSGGRPDARTPMLPWKKLWPRARKRTCGTEMTS